MRRKEPRLFLARCAMEPLHLLHSALPYASTGKVGTASHMETSYCSRRTIHDLSDDNSRNVALFLVHRWNVEWLKNTMKLRIFITSNGTHSQDMALPRTAWVRLNCRRHRSCLRKWGMAVSTACGCGNWESAEFFPVGKRRHFA